MPSLRKTDDEAVTEHRKGIFALLARLSLHPFGKANLTESQSKLAMEDTVRDLQSYSLEKIAWACDAWRKSDARFFPRSGELMAMIDKRIEESIATARANRQPFRAPRLLEDQNPPKLRPAAEILAERREKLLDQERNKPKRSASEILSTRNREV